MAGGQTVSVASRLAEPGGAHWMRHEIEMSKRCRDTLSSWRVVS